MRMFFLYILPVLLPLVIYFIWQQRNKRLGVVKNSKKIPPFILIITVIMLFLVTAVALILDNGIKGDSIYIKAKYENGEFIPAKSIKKDN